MNRVRAGFCLVRNPFNATQVTRVSLAPEDVEAMVFWTRNPQPMMDKLDELEATGLRFYFQVTLMDNPRWLDLRAPGLEAAVDNFRKLSERIGPQRVVWRYDPVVLTNEMPPAFHCEVFGRIAERLRGATQRVMVSVLDDYKHAARRMRGLDVLAPTTERLGEFLPFMREAAAQNGMTVYSCVEALDMARFGIQPGACVDGRLIGELFGIAVPSRKDPNQRAVCGCVASKDIGAYETCVLGCRYCYATRSLERAEQNCQQHDPASPFLA